jgi:hypothetical protein
MLSLPVLADGNRQTVGIKVLCEPCAKNILRLLDAPDILLHHRSVERIQVRHAEARPATSRGKIVRIYAARLGRLGHVKRQRGPVGRKLGPAWRLESEWQPEHVPIESHDRDMSLTKTIA